MRKILITTMMFAMLSTPARALEPITLIVVPLLTIKFWESVFGVNQSEEPTKAGYESTTTTETNNGKE